MKLFITILIVSLCISCAKEEIELIYQEDEPLTDFEGNSYKTVKIGEQIWMAENLKTFYYRNGDDIGQVRGSSWTNLSRGAHCYYEGETVVPATFVLYNCWAIQDERNIAPEGWHVSTEEDWITLEKYIRSKIGYDASVAKALSSTWGWKSSDRPNTVGYDMSSNNSSGFNALPSGVRHHDGSYYNQGMSTCFWTGGGLTGSHREILWLSDGISGGESGNLASYGYSVRCVKD